MAAENLLVTSNVYFSSCNHAVGPAACTNVQQSTVSYITTLLAPVGMQRPQEMMPRWHDDLVDHFRVGLDPEACTVLVHVPFLTIIPFVISNCAECLLVSS